MVGRRVKSFEQKGDKVEVIFEVVDAASQVKGEVTVVLSMCAQRLFCDCLVTAHY